VNISRPLSVPETRPTAIRVAPATEKCPRRRDIGSANCFASLSRSIVASLVGCLSISSEIIAGQVRCVLTLFCLVSRRVNRKSEVLRNRPSGCIAGQRMVCRCRDACARRGVMFLNLNRLLRSWLSALKLDVLERLFSVRSGLLSLPVKDAFAEVLDFHRFRADDFGMGVRRFPVALSSDVWKS
jgi:hypothetical protein